MEELAKLISAKMIEFDHEMNDNVTKGNKAAGLRARKASLDLEKLLKQYRKLSVK